MIMKNDFNGMTFSDTFRDDLIELFQFYFVRFRSFLMERDVISIFIMGNMSLIIKLREMAGFDGATSVAYQREAADRFAVRKFAEIRTDRVAVNMGTVFAQTGIAVTAETYLFTLVLNTAFVSLILTDKEVTMRFDFISDATRITMKFGSDIAEFSTFIKKGFKNLTLFKRKLAAFTHNDTSFL